MESGWVGLRAGGEFDLIRAFARAAGAATPPPELAVQPGDDAVGLTVPEGETLLLSTDVTVEDVHFRRAWASWEIVGRRAVAAALSDLAAMAARPLGVLVTLMLPPELDHEVVEGLGRGAGECLGEVGASLLGGDLSRTPAGVAVDVVAAGAASRPVGRDGAAPGDELWVTGELGGPASAVRDWIRGLEPDPRSRRAFARPVPRISEARWLADRLDLRAMIDLSDGLGADAAQLAAASGVGIDIELERLPLAPALEEEGNQELARRQALAGGEDYELLLAAPAAAVEGGLRRDFFREFGIPLGRVGTVTDAEGVLRVDGRPLEPGGGGYDHFPGSRT